MARSIEQILTAELGTLAYQCCLREYQLGVATEEIARLRALVPKPAPAEPAAAPTPIVSSRRQPKARRPVAELDPDA